MLSSHVAGMISSTRDLYVCIDFSAVRYYQIFSITVSQKSDNTLGFLNSAPSDIILQVKETDFGQIL